MSKWTPTLIKSQVGNTIVITGASSGIGLEAAKVLNEKGAHVIAAVRNPLKAKGVLPASVEIRDLDLSDLNSAFSFLARLIACPLFENETFLYLGPGYCVNMFDVLRLMGLESKNTAHTPSDASTCSVL